MKYISCCLVVIFIICTSLRAEILLNDDFTQGTSAGLPSKATHVLPAKPSNTLAVQIVSGADNIAGGGKGYGVRILDNDPKFAILEYNIVTSAESQRNAIKVGFDLAWNPPADPEEGEEHSTLYFNIGLYQKERIYLNAKAKRLVTASFFNDGMCNFHGGLATRSKNFDLSARKADRFTFYLNDYDEVTLTTTSPDGGPLALAPNTMLVYRNDRQLCRLAVEKFMNTEKQMGRIGFSTTSDGRGLDFTISALRVETLDDDLSHK